MAIIFCVILTGVRGIGVVRVLHSKDSKSRLLDWFIESGRKR